MENIGYRGCRINAQAWRDRERHWSSGQRPRGRPGMQSVGLWAASAQKERNPTLQSRPDHQREGRICLPRPHAHPTPGPPSPAQGKQEQRKKPGPSAVHIQPLTRICLNCLLPSPHHPKREPCSGHFPAHSPSWLLISPRDLLSWHSEPSWPLSLGPITAPEAPRLSHTAPNRTHRTPHMAPRDSHSMCSPILRTALDTLPSFSEGSLAHVSGPSTKGSSSLMPRLALSPLMPAGTQG